MAVLLRLRGECGFGRDGSCWSARRPRLRPAPRTDPLLGTRAGCFHVGTCTRHNMHALTMPPSMPPYGSMISAHGEQRPIAS